MPSMLDRSSVSCPVVTNAIEPRQQSIEDRTEKTLSAEGSDVQCPLGAHSPHMTTPSLVSAAEVDVLDATLPVPNETPMELTRDFTLTLRKSSTCRFKEAVLASSEPPADEQQLGLQSLRSLGHSQSARILPLEKLAESYSPSGELSHTPRLQRSLSTPTMSPRLPHTCPACMQPVKPSALETLGCGIHLCCSDCAKQSSRLQVRSGRLPRCFEPNCGATIEPLVALRLLDREDHELYMQLALWSNPCIETCPLCSSLIFTEYLKSVEWTSTAQCPSCLRFFCSECRCPAHPGRGCEEALRIKEASISQMLGDGEKSRWKSCPRCCFAIEKDDVDTCDHMTCVRCNHEFCWSCLADRKVIFAHGNHRHRPSCKFYAPFAGQDSYLPNACPKCARRGTTCRPSRSLVTCVGQRSSAFVSMCMQVFRGGA